MRAFFRNYLDLLSLDPRALGVFRVFLGTCALVDILRKFSLWQDHYSNAGLLPVELAKSLLVPDVFCALFVPDPVALLIWAAGAGIAVAFLLGWHARFAALLLWLFLCSLQNRNILVLSHGDNILRWVVFWSAFLPIGARFSLDERQGRGAGPESRVAAFAFLLQIAVIYLFSVLTKSGPTWRSNYDALYYALNIELWVSSLGLRLLELDPTILRAATMYVFWLEALGPLLIFVPWISKKARLVVPFLFFGFHFSLVVFMMLGTFEWTCMAPWIAVLPAAFWDKLALRFPSFASVAPVRENPAGDRRQLWLGVIAMLALALIVESNVNFLRTGTRSGGAFAAIRETFRFRQSWDFYSPDPYPVDGWWAFEGTTKDGKTIDAYTPGKPFSLEKPPHEFLTGFSVEWRKYWDHTWGRRNTTRGDRGKIRDRLFDRLCAANPELARIRFHYVAELTPANYGAAKTYPEPKEEKICGVPRETEK